MTSAQARAALLALVTTVLLAGLAFAQDAGADASASTAEAPQESAAEVSFSEDIQPFLTQNCYACHLTGSASADLSLQPGTAYDDLVGVASTQSDLARVEPGEPEASYLLHKLRGTHLDVGGSGAQMPLGGGSVPDETLALVEAWIAAGAPNQ